MSEIENKKIDYFEIIIAPIKYWKILIIFNIFIIVISSILILFVSKIMPPEESFLSDKYKSEAKILIPYKDTSAYKVGDIGDLANPSGLSVERGVKTSQVIISLLQSNIVVDGVIDNYYLIKHPKIADSFKKKKIRRENLRKIVLKNAEFKKDDATSFIFVRYEDTNPVVAKETVDVFLSMLDKVTHNFALTQTVLKRRFIEERLKEIEMKLSQAKADFINFQQIYGIISPENEALQITTTVSTLRSQLINKETELDNYRRIHKLKKNEKTDLDYEVEDLRNKILKLTKNKNENIDDRNIIISKNTISELSSEFQNLKRNVENFETIHSSLLNELELAQIQEKSEGSMIQILDPSEIPSVKSSQSRILILIKVIVLFFILSIIIVVCIEFIKQILKNNPDIINKVKTLWIKSNREEK